MSVVLLFTRLTDTHYHCPIFETKGDVIAMVHRVDHFGKRRGISTFIQMKRHEAYDNFSLVSVGKHVFVSVGKHVFVSVGKHVL
jgi:hypothetical protein